MRHPKSRIHVQLRAESGLAALLFLRAPHPRVPEQGHRHVRATQVYDVQHGSRQEDTRKWKLKLRQQGPGQEQPREFEEKCDLLLYTTGILNNFKWPDIQGLHDFKGRVVHTGYWPKDYQKEQ
jgi:cation diffusion facilitator CzcD-associated flavoprotein CzcO